MAVPTLVGVEPAGQETAALGHAVDQRPVEHLPEPGVGESTRSTSAPCSSARARASRAGGERLDDPPHLPAATSVDLLGRLAPVQLGRLHAGPVAGVDDPFGQLVAEHAHGQHLGREPAGDVVGHLLGSICRGDGANTKPTASAPRATASRASSSLVMPQIFTNTPVTVALRPRDDREFDDELHPTTSWAAIMTGVATFADKPTLAGTRVTLRPIDAADADSMWASLADAEAARLTELMPSSPGCRLTPGAASRPACDDRLDLAVTDAATGAWAGELVINDWDEDNRSCGFRIALDAGFRNRGFGTEATRLIVDYAFSELPIHRISLEVFDFNPRAIATYEKVGFRREGVLRDALWWDDEFHDTIVMGLLRTEWPPPS